VTGDDSTWTTRQQEMEAWYQHLIARPRRAVRCFTDDYGPYSSLLHNLSGTVLDIGGGNGILRHYLRDDVRYIVLDPSVEWLRSEWAALANGFPCLKTKPPFIQGVGEYLPFAAGCFDAVLAFWSLNHASWPWMIFDETHRVLKTGGRFILALEDMEPKWSDLFVAAFVGDRFSRTARMIARKFACILRGQPWPIQSDHIAIIESDMLDWISGKFDITKRFWVKTYLSLEFRKLDSNEACSLGLSGA